MHTIKISFLFFTRLVKVKWTSKYQDLDKKTISNINI